MSGRPQRDRDRPVRSRADRLPSELPADPSYWSGLANRIEAESLPELRAALERSRERSVGESSSLGWLEWVGQVGRWAIPAGAVASALFAFWLVAGTARTGPEAHAGTVATDSAADLSASAWRQIVAPENSLGRLIASPSPPSVADLLPWTSGVVSTAEVGPENEQVQP